MKKISSRTISKCSASQKEGHISIYLHGNRDRRGSDHKGCLEFYLGQILQYAILNLNQRNSVYGFKASAVEELPRYQINSRYHLLGAVKTNQVTPFSVRPGVLSQILALTHQMLCESLKRYPILPPSSSSCFFSPLRTPHPCRSSCFPSLHDLATVLASVSFRTNKTYSNMI